MSADLTHEPYESTELPDWARVRKAFDLFPRPKLHRDSDGELRQAMWIFRGHKSGAYHLKPTIERQCRAGSISWAALELKVLDEEFRPKARMHMVPADLPASEDTLSWLGLMQHHGVPTRLLDFTFSPYIALYFALRSRTDKERSSGAVVVWAIDVEALRNVAAQISGEAHNEEVKHGIGEPLRFTRWDLDLAVEESGELRSELKWRSELLSNALAPSPVRGSYFKEKGFVAFAMPPVQDPRLSSQQGAFLFNGAEALTFEKSLFQMMSGRKAIWWRRFRIPNAALLDLEERLFQMNIHELSLFPDMQGLAGFIRQKLRLYWVPNDNPSTDES